MSMTGSAGSLASRAALLAGAALAVSASAGLAHGAPREPGGAGTGTTVVTHGTTVVVHPHGRFGPVPMRGRPGAVPSTSPDNLQYGGGTDGIGVTTGKPQVYIVYWGSDWGAPTTDGQGYVHLANDASGLAPYQQAFFKGIGTGGETWSGVETQYCQDVPVGTQTCPDSAAHVGYPTGGALAGVWVDRAAPAPAAATQAQIAAEAVAAAAHFGNTTAAANRNVQYVITSPSGTNPDNWLNQGFCAWHDFTTSAYGDLAYTNFPYTPDAGSSCGQGFVNFPGELDGVSIVGGHEYDETITDQNPVGGWIDASGEENADKCAWVSFGDGAARNLTLTTGTFAVQTTWSNDANAGAGGCQFTHPIVAGGGGGGTVNVTNPGNQTATVGRPFSLQIQASDSAGLTLTYSASGLPSGLTIAPTSGLISGTPTAAGSYATTVTATDTAGASSSAAFSISVAAVSRCRKGQLVANGGFETGSASPWTGSTWVVQNAGAGEPAHSGSWLAWLDGYGVPTTESLAQSITLPAGCLAAKLSLWLHIDTAETTHTTAYDVLTLQLVTASGVHALATYSNLNAALGYQHHTFDLLPYLGQVVTLQLVGTEDASLQTSFVVDDVTLKVS
jgi:serine protease